MSSRVGAAALGPEPELPGVQREEGERHDDENGEEGNNGHERGPVRPLGHGTARPWAGPRGRFQLDVGGLAGSLLAPQRLTVGVLLEIVSRVLALSRTHSLTLTRGRSNSPHAHRDRPLSLLSSAGHRPKLGSIVLSMGIGLESGAAIWEGLTGIVAVAAGGGQNLLLTKDGQVIASGENDRGQATVPVGLSDVTAIAAGYAHNLALRGDGTVVAWGNTTRGATNVPPGLHGVTAITAGGGTPSRSRVMALLLHGGTWATVRRLGSVM